MFDTLRSLVVCTVHAKDVTLDETSSDGKGSVSGEAIWMH